MNEHSHLRSDWSLYALLALWAALLNGIGLGALDFFRHTEADRTLIAWEMSEHGQYLVPHLLGSPILTKPPLYYWLVSAAISWLGNAEESTARLVSFVSSILFLLLQFFAWRKAGFNRMWSLAAAILFGSTSAFMVHATVAEIDMLFAFLTAVSLYALYFALSEAKLGWTLCAYGALALAFLTKGPPVVFFFLASAVQFLVYVSLYAKDSEAPALQRRFSRQSIVGVALFGLLLAAWLIPLAESVGWEALKDALQVEVFERVVYPAERPRGPFFYLGSLFIGLLPWSLPALIGLVTFRKAPQGTPLELLAPARSKSFFVYSAIVLLSALAMLTLAEGKSSRYLFPVHVFALNLAMLGLSVLPRLSFARHLFTVGFWASILLMCAGVGMAFAFHLEGVSRIAWLLSGAAILGSAMCMAMSCSGSSVGGVFISVLLMMVTVRVTQLEIYTPHRNATRSVRPIANEINRRLPPKAPVYTVELFERWVNYYLKRVGRETYRVSPELLKTKHSESGRVFLLLSSGEELWRLEQLRFYDSTVKVLGEFHQANNGFILVEAAESALPYLEPKTEFPTVPSLPFYAERAGRL